jgi:4-hydroxy-2-oxoheptanedioate aldolase
MGNRVKECYEAGKQSIGTFLNLGSGVSAECLGIAGVDYFIFDTEHSPFDLAEISSCVRSAELHRTTPFVRVKEISRSSILKVLDVGAKGIIIPGVKTAEEVAVIIEFGNYPPMGNRGFCPTRCCDYGYTGALDQGIGPYMEDRNRDCLIVPQCETRECLEHIEEILEIEGVDGIFIGPFDLSIALGKPGQFADAELTTAFDRVLRACKAARKPAFIFAPSISAAKLRLEQGFDSVTCSADLNVLIETYQSMMTELKPSAKV